MPETTRGAPTRPPTPGGPHPDAPLEITGLHREVLEQVLDRWSLQVLETLCERPCRFSELRRVIPAVTGKSLTATLRRLERNGVVERRVVSTRPVAVEYRISALGKSMREPIDGLLTWTAQHLAEVEEARARFELT